MGMHICIITILLSVFNVSADEVAKPRRRFELDWAGYTFRMNGSPFTYAAGEIHYFRVPHQYWRDRLEKSRDAGLNTVSTYVEWSQHELNPGEYNFEGDLDIVRFIETANDVGLYVILRPGPYICAERDFGGFPAWLLSVNPNMSLRTSDPSFTLHVMRWFKILMPMMEKYLYGNGGPILMVQIENEYGSYETNDRDYMLWLRDLLNSYVKNASVLFTADGYSPHFLKDGSVPNVLTTINTNGDGFDPKELRDFQPQGPIVISELYTGWLTYWGHPYGTRDTQSLIDTLKILLERNISFCLYMFHGGTNFGFTAGSGSSKYLDVDITSYDYDAPITEDGDLTEKYFAIKAVLKDRNTSLDDYNYEPSPTSDYGEVELAPIVSLFDSPVSTSPVHSDYPKTFEELGQWYGFVAYHTVISNTLDGSELDANIRDRAIVYLDKVELGVLEYTRVNNIFLPPSTSPQTLTLLVENQGRRNFQLLNDCTKGIVANATLGDKLLIGWEIVGYPLSPEDVAKVEAIKPGRNTKNILPGYFSAEFFLPEGEIPKDTFLDTSHWGKGVAFINGFNLGRYWHVGPQVTLYVPGIHLKKYPLKNRITLMELHFTHPQKSITFLPYPIIMDINDDDEEVEYIEDEEYYE